MKTRGRAAGSTTLPPATLAAWRGFAETMLHAAWLVQAAAVPRIVAANDAAGALVGLDVGALTGCAALELLASPEDQAFWREAASANTQGPVVEIESDTLLRRPDGSIVPVRRRARALRLESPGDAAIGGAPLYVVALHDRSAQLQAERALELSLTELRTTLESTHDGILVTDLAGRIRNFNRRFAALWSVPEELLVRGQDDAVLEWMRRSAADPGAYMRRLAAIESGVNSRSVDVVRLRSGKVFERVVTPQFNQGQPVGRVYAFRDVTEKLEAHERIQLLSYTDALTGLPNRRLLADRIEVALATARRDGSPFAFLLLNLDRFSHIIEAFGHALADRVIVDVAERIKGCMRQVDTVARLGADEFVIVVQQADEHGAEAAALRVIDALKQPFVQSDAKGDMRFTVTCSIGIAMHPSDGADLDDLERRANAAMREVKGAGRAGFRFHRSRPAPRGDAPLRSRMKLDHAMRQALAQGRFRVHFQPQVQLAGAQAGRTIGAEALVRWRDPELGEISPGEFIPVAEESGFIVAIDDWVLREAVQQAAAWHAAGHALVMSVNVSALQFQQPAFVDRVAAVLREAALPARYLELELTESILIQDAQEAMLRLQALAQLGVKLAIDDFGTGYSSLAYLKRFPIGRLKIDRSFIGGLPDEESDAAIVQAIVSMARALRLQVVAEGVEYRAQCEFLQRSGCDQGQGYLFAPALDAAAFERRLLEDAAIDPAESEPAPLAG
jgi:diguanylate cyclase (GGDEF)-like protein/PAS domain S-box-containing protein